MTNVKVPPQVQEKHPDLVKMILESQSMDDNERNYWLSVLLIMTPEQVQNLRDILNREKKRFEEIDETEKDAKKLVNEGKVDEAKTRVSLEKRRMLAQSEKKYEQQEENVEGALLQEIESM